MSVFGFTPPLRSFCARSTSVSTNSLSSGDADAVARAVRGKIERRNGFPEIARLHVHVERAVALGVGKPRDAVHLAYESEILKQVGLIDEQPVDAELFPGDRVILALAAGAFLEPGLQAFLRFPSSLTMRLAEFMRDDDPVVIARRDAVHGFLAGAGGEGVLARNEDMGVRIEGEERRAPLLDQVIGHDDHGFARQSQALHLRGGGDHLEGLARYAVIGIMQSVFSPAARRRSLR
ncbi:MAG TPA: hypothetical protein VHZ07_04170 [Bryobacteraceae bacterium]|nr:hypothetical protein [Bryobacteraceae bacterium]